MAKGKKAIIVGVIVIIIAAAGFWFWSQRNSVNKETGTAAGNTLGGQIFDKTQSPAKNVVPQTNPYSASTNPFEKSGTNPLQDVYQNPF